MLKNIEVESITKLPVNMIKKLYKIVPECDCDMIDWDYFIKHKDTYPIKNFWDRFATRLDIPTLQEIILKETDCFILEFTKDEVTLTFGDESRLYGTELIDVLFEAVKSILGFIEIKDQE